MVSSKLEVIAEQSSLQTSLNWPLTTYRTMIPAHAVLTHSIHAEGIKFTDVTQAHCLRAEYSDK